MIPIRHPVPTRMRNEHRHDEDTHALFDADSIQQAQGRYKQYEHKNLTEFNADIESQKRGQEVRPAELQGLPKGK